jgi:CelD/BcsL family acetyltransferase involved in cellulose biosynthesis
MPAIGRRRSGAARVEAVEHVADFERLEPEWTDLLRASRVDGVFLTWPWLHAWWQHLGAGRQLWVLTVRIGGQLAGALPLAISPGRETAWPRLPVAEFLGSGAVGSDYLDVIARRDVEREVTDALAAYLADRRGLVLRLHGVAGGRSLAADLAARLAGRDWTPVTTPAGICPFIPLAGRSWTDVLQGLGQQHRYNVRRRRRNLAKTHDVTFVEVRSDAERRDALDRLIRLHNTRWDARGGSTALHTPALVGFHHAVSRRFLERGWLRLAELRVDGRPVAAIYGILYDGRFFFYQSGFDERFARHSVGLVALGYSIERAIDEGAREYDLLHGDEEYKSRWTSRARELVRLELYPPGARARLQRTATAARRRLGRWVRPALAPLRRSRHA